MDSRRAEGGNKNYELKEVREHHVEIARRLVLGQRPVEIASALGITPQTVSNVRNNPVVKELVIALQNERNDNTQDVVRQVSALAPNAIKLLEQVINYRDVIKNRDHEALPLEIPELSDQIKVAMKVVDITVPKVEVKEEETVTKDMINRIKGSALTRTVKITKGGNNA